MESTWSAARGIGVGSDWFEVASEDGNTSTEVEATEDVDSGNNATGATSTEEHKTSIDEAGVDKEKSDIIESSYQ